MSDYKERSEREEPTLEELCRRNCYETVIDQTTYCGYEALEEQCIYRGKEFEGKYKCGMLEKQYHG